MKVTEEQRAIYDRMMSERLRHTGAVDHSTNWRNAAESLRKEKQPYLLGEGLGNTPFIAPKYVRGFAPNELERMEQEAEEYRSEMAQRRQIRMERQREAEQALRRSLPQKIATGSTLVRQRIFRTAWAKKDWETRANLFGGLPSGMDVASTPYGRLLIVPVIEEDEAKELGLLQEKVPKKNQLRDTDGRRFWVSAEIKEFVSQVFGVIDWKRPLSIVEAEQFGVRL